MQTKIKKYNYNFYNFDSTSSYQELLNDYEKILYHYDELDANTRLSALSTLYSFTFKEDEYFQILNKAVGGNYSKIVELPSTVEVENNYGSYVDKTRLYIEFAAIDSFIVEDKKYSSIEIENLISNKVLLPLNIIRRVIDEVSKDSETIDNIHDCYSDKLYFTKSNSNDDILIISNDKYSKYVMEYIDSHIDKKKMYKDLLFSISVLTGQLRDYLHFIPYKVDVLKRDIRELHEVQNVFNRSLKLTNFELERK